MSGSKWYHMKYGYVRTSTDGQTTTLQFVALKRSRCSHFFEDRGLSGPTAKRRPAPLPPDRLGRSLRDVITMLDELRECGTGRAMWQMIGVLAELERSLTTARARAGVKTSTALRR